MGQLSKDQHEAIQALERLSVRRRILTVEEARAIARQIAGDPAFEFPPKPDPAPPARAPPAPAGAETSDGAATPAPE